MNRICVCWL